MKKLNEIKRKLTYVDQELDKLYEYQRELENEFENTRNELLFNDRSILRESTWTLNCNNIFSLYLKDNNLNGFKKLRELYESGYHISISISPKINIFFNDGELTVSGSSNNDLLAFIKNNNLIISNDLLEKITEIDEEISNLILTKETINNLNNSLL